MVRVNRLCVCGFPNCPGDKPVERWAQTTKQWMRFFTEWKPSSVSEPYIPTLDAQAITRAVNVSQRRRRNRGGLPAA